jgi:hypothetical protein
MDIVFDGVALIRHIFPVLKGAIRGLFVSNRAFSIHLRR